MVICYHGIFSLSANFVPRFETSTFPCICLGQGVFLSCLTLHCGCNPFEFQVYNGKGEIFPNMSTLEGPWDLSLLP